MLIIIKSSSHSPANSDNSAIPRASPPADKVPNPLLNPLLRVAPALIDRPNGKHEKGIEFIEPNGIYN